MVLEWYEKKNDNNNVEGEKVQIRRSVSNLVKNLTKATRRFVAHVGGKEVASIRPKKIEVFHNTREVSMGSQ